MSFMTTAPALPAQDLETYVGTLSLVGYEVPSCLDASSAHSSSVESLGSEADSGHSDKTLWAPNTWAATSASVSRAPRLSKISTSALGRPTVLDRTPGLRGTALTKSFCEQLSAVKSANPHGSIHDYLGVSEGDDPRHKEALWTMCSEWAERVKERSRHRQTVRCRSDNEVTDVSEVDQDVLTGAMFEKRLHAEHLAGGATKIERNEVDNGKHITWTYKGNGWEMQNKRPSIYRESH
ncbi:hypothetical protein IAT38_004915 [Cryptococcus sp. DSM 104549]